MALKLPILQPTPVLNFAGSRFIFLKLFLLVFFTGRTVLGDTPSRVISLSPSITEVVFALEKGNSLVGVSSYSDFPQEAKSITSVGGLYDSNLEQILSLKPDLLIAPAEHKLAQPQYSFNGVKKVLVSQENLSEIDDSILKIGAALYKIKSARELVETNRKEIAAFKEKFKGRKLSALVVFGGADSLQSVFVSGDKTLYQEILEFLGAENAYSGELEFPKLSPEGLISTSPDLIINLIPEVEGTVVKTEEVLKRWRELPGLSKILKKNIFVLTDEYLVNPGPRYPLIVRDFARVLEQTRD